jgi:replicative DNA helicase
MVENLHYNKDLEKAILGACLIELSAFGRIYGLIDRPHFYSEDNQKVYATMLKMFNQAQPIDLLTVAHQMIADGESLHAGNIAWYLTTLTNAVTGTTHLEFHCHLVSDMWRKRELEAIFSSLDPLTDIQAQIAAINKRMSELQGRTQRKEWVDMEELMMSLVEHQHRVQSGQLEFITTGFRRIDEINGGFSGNQFVIVGARPSVGKTALMVKISREVARSGVGVGIISLETDNVRIAARIASGDTGVSFQTIYRSLFKEESEQKIFFNRISNQTAKLPIYVSDKTKVDINEIRAKAHKIAKIFESRGIEKWVLMLDYIQLVETYSNKNYNREQEISKISRGCKLLASELNKVVIALAQLTRESGKRTGNDRYPKLSDLRESGSLEQDADIVLMLHRDWMAGIEVNEEGNSTEREADLLAVKWRDGAPFKIKLDYEAETMTFNEVVGF